MFVGIVALLHLTEAVLTLCAAKTHKTDRFDSFFHLPDVWICLNLNSVVWLDLRTQSTVENLINKAPGKDKNHLKVWRQKTTKKKKSHVCVLYWDFQFMDCPRPSLQHKTGLPISTYFSAVKLRWLLDNVDEVRQAVLSGRAMFGTVDSWIIWVSYTRVNAGPGKAVCCCASRESQICISPVPDGGQQRGGPLYWRDKRQSHHALQHSHHGLGLWTLQVSNTLNS